METEYLHKELLELYLTTLDFEFRKSTYQKHMESLKTRYGDLLQKVADACSGNGEVMEKIASWIPEYVSEQLKEIRSKRKREIRSLDFRMNMVSFFMPLIGEIPSENAKELADMMVKLWNLKMPDGKIAYSNYESIKGGFKKGIFCYITTAVCHSLDKPDDCYELETLRRYRDEYLSSTENGREIVKEYYNVAPTIVRRIDRLENARQIYDGIWSEYLKPCIRLIEEDRKEECRILYTEMVEKLEKQYLYT